MKYGWIPPVTAFSVFAGAAGAAGPPAHRPRDRDGAEHEYPDQPMTQQVAI